VTQEVKKEDKPTERLWRPLCCGIQNIFFNQYQ